MTKLNRTELLRAYFNNIPTASCPDAVAAMKKRGVTVSLSLACAVKYAKIAPKLVHAIPHGTRTRVMKRNEVLPGDVLVAHVLQAHAFSKRVGGISKAKETMHLLEQLV